MTQINTCANKLNKLTVDFLLPLSFPTHQSTRGYQCVLKHQCCASPFGALHPIDRHTLCRFVMLVQELCCQAVALTISHEKGTTWISRVVRIQPHHCAVLKATFTSTWQKNKLVCGDMTKLVDHIQPPSDHIV